MIIAEIGMNYCNDMDLACYLIYLAKENGADLVKFQLFDYEKLYPKHNIPKVELTFKEAKDLFDYGQNVGIEVFFSVFDVERIRWCEEIGVKRYKLSCNERDYDLGSAIERTQKPVLVSVQDFEEEPEMPAGFWHERVETLYCIPKYPAHIKDYKLRLIDEFDGISDHSKGIDLAKIVLVLNPNSIIEKHFCLDHHTGIDAEWSMDYLELRELKRWEQVCQSVL